MIVDHPYRALMAEAEQERQIIAEPEGEALRQNIFDALHAYGEFLDSRGLIWADERPRASELVATLIFGVGLSLTLKDGALDRVYGNGRNPDPFGAGPSDIPHRMRP